MSEHCLFHLHRWAGIHRHMNFICRRVRTLCLFHLHRWAGIHWRMNFICRRVGKHCLFHLHRWVGIRLWRWNTQSVPTCRHVKLRRQGITRKKAYKHSEYGKSLKSRILHLYGEETARHIRLLEKLCIILHIYPPMKTEQTVFQNVGI